MSARNDTTPARLPGAFTIGVAAAFGALVGRESLHSDAGARAGSLVALCLATGTPLAEAASLLEAADRQGCEEPRAATPAQNDGDVIDVEYEVLS